MDATLVGAVTSGLTGITTNATTMLTAVLPIALGFVAIVAGVRWGISFFRGTAKA